MIYILQGSTGAYEDVYTWVVRAYTSKEQAEADCKKATEEADAYCDEVRLLNEGFYSAETTDKEYEEFQEMLECKRQEMITVDPYADFDEYYGTSYNVVATELI